jgi:integrase/recombinase XerD
MTNIIPVTLGFDTSQILAGSVGPASIEMYTRDFKAYLEYAGSPGVAFNVVTLNKWIVEMANNTRMSPNTINRMVSAIKKIMKIAANQGYISHEVADSFRHVDGVKVGALKDRMRIRNRVKIEPDTMRLLVDSIDTSTLVGMRNKALFTTLASSGLRIKELALLKPEQILKRGNGYILHMYAEVGKNQIEDREAHVSVEAVGAIQEWIEARSMKSEYIFTSFKGRGNRPLATPITPMGAWKVVKRLTEKIGIPNVKPHDFRRFVGTLLAKNDIREAQIALGHKRIETTAKYDLREIRVGATDNLY